MELMEDFVIVLKDIKTYGVVVYKNWPNFTKQEEFKQDPLVLKY